MLPSFTPSQALCACTQTLLCCPCPLRRHPTIESLCFRQKQEQVGHLPLLHLHLSLTLYLLQSDTDLLEGMSAQKCKRDEVKCTVKIRFMNLHLCTVRISLLRYHSCYWIFSYYILKWHGIADTGIRPAGIYRQRYWVYTFPQYLTCLHHLINSTANMIDVKALHR